MWITCTRCEASACAMHGGRCYGEKKLTAKAAVIRERTPRSWTGSTTVQRRQLGARRPAATVRVENGTGKSRPDRLRLSFKPTANRFRGKNRKMEKQNGKTGGNGNGWGVFPIIFTVPFSAGKIPAGIPVFVVVGCVTCVGNVNCCLHVFQREL